jgi:hypothetical protein
MHENLFYLNGFRKYIFYLSKMAVRKFSEIETVTVLFILLRASRQTQVRALRGEIKGIQTDASNDRFCRFYFRAGSH